LLQIATGGEVWSSQAPYVEEAAFDEGKTKSDRIHNESVVRGSEDQKKGARET
jgi:hypothetical protein